MSLIRESGRFDRGAVIARAREIFADCGNWQQAMSHAYREASAERAAPPAPISAQVAHA